jgi:hypothetical protein
VLNACRVLMTRQKGEGTVASKEEGGLWALDHLPPQYHPLIQKTLDIYRSPTAIEAGQRRRGGVKWDDAALLAFRDYIRRQLGKTYT